MVKDHGVQIYTSTWQQNTDNSYDGVPKVDSVTCRFKHKYLHYLFVCNLCQLYMDASFDNKIGESEAV